SRRGGKGHAGAKNQARERQVTNSKCDLADSRHIVHSSESPLGHSGIELVLASLSPPWKLENLLAGKGLPAASPGRTGQIVPQPPARPTCHIRQRRACSLVRGGPERKIGWIKRGQSEKEEAG